MERKKRTIIQALVCVALVCVIWIGYFYVRDYKVNRIIEVKENDFSWVYQLDSFYVNDGELVLEGFAFKLNSDAENGAFEIVLRDIESERLFFPEMEYVLREDVNDYFSCNYDYTEVGFVAKIKEKKIDLNKNYEMILRVSGKKLAYHTDVFISNEKIMYVNPLEYKTLEVAGTDIEKIVEKGVLRVYRPDYGMYVYQYGGELYWIAEKTYGFVEGDTLIQYQLETTQKENLPTYRLENRWYWDNIGFKFSEKELTEWNTGEYRVARNSIPKEYAVSKMWTGNHIDNWIWKEDFYPYYEFDK